MILGVKIHSVRTLAYFWIADEHNGISVMPYKNLAVKKILESPKTTKIKHAEYF